MFNKSEIPNKGERAIGGNKGYIGSDENLKDIMSAEEEAKAKAREQRFGRTVLEKAPNSISELSEMLLDLEERINTVAELPDLSEEGKQQVNILFDRLEDLINMSDPMKLRLLVTEGIVDIERNLNNILITRSLNKAPKPDNPETPDLHSPRWTDAFSKEPLVTDGGINDDFLDGMDEEEPSSRPSSEAVLSVSPDDRNFPQQPENGGGLPNLGKTGDSDDNDK
ncbi:hypothetical protein IIY24_01425 [Candidatus Saccharibacteria bacterium]|nr:hypothetical protein [Candidatus Saccharibacteria bacterium]